MAFSIKGYGAPHGLLGREEAGPVLPRDMRCLETAVHSLSLVPRRCRYWRDYVREPRGLASHSRDALQNASTCLQPLRLRKSTMHCSSSNAQRASGTKTDCGEMTADCPDWPVFSCSFRNPWAAHAQKVLVIDVRLALACSDRPDTVGSISQSREQALRGFPESLRIPQALFALSLLPGYIFTRTYLVAGQTMGQAPRASWQVRTYARYRVSHRCLVASQPGL